MKSQYYLHGPWNLLLRNIYTSSLDQYTPNKSQLRIEHTQHSPIQ